MAAEKMHKMRGKYADIPRLGLGMQDLGVINSWIQDRLRLGKLGVELKELEEKNKVSRSSSS